MLMNRGLNGIRESRIYKRHTGTKVQRHRVTELNRFATLLLSNYKGVIDAI